MYSTKMSLKSFIFVVSVILYSVNQVSALQCYVCASGPNGECYKNPKQEHYKTDCSAMNDLPQFQDSPFNRIGSDIQRILTNYTGNNIFRAMLQAECMTIIGVMGNEKAVIRSCSPKIMSCDLWKHQLQSSNMRVDSCDKCENDMCNSAQHLSVGFLSLIGSLLIFVFARM